MNIPNSLTILRILLIPVYVGLLVYERFEAAMGVLLLAGVTDALDGTIARAANQRTRLGAFLDPLADKLLLIGLDTAGDPTLRFVLLVEARDLGAQAGDAGMIARAVDALAEHYRVDAWTERAKAIIEGSKQATPEACEALAQAGLEMADEAVLTEEFGGALALVRAAQAAARKSTNRDLVKEAAARLKEIQAARRGA